MFEFAKGEVLDKIADIYWMRRKTIRSITLLFGWKLVKQESDNDLKKRIMNQVAKFKQNGGEPIGGL